MRNRDLRPTAKANPTIQQTFERFQKYNRLKNLSQGSLDFYAAKGRNFFRFLGDTEQPIHTITEETVEDYIFHMKDQQLHDTTINLELSVPKGEKATIQQAAKQAGQSVNAYIYEVVCARMQQENAMLNTLGVVKNLEGDADPVE